MTYSRTSPARMAKGMLFVFIPMIITLYLTITLWHFTSSFPPHGKSGTYCQHSAVQVPHVRRLQAKPNTITIPAGASVQGNPRLRLQLCCQKRSCNYSEILILHLIPHSGTSLVTKNGKSWDTSLIMPGKSAKINTANLAPGNYPYHCTVHPYMKGILTITA